MKRRGWLWFTVVQAAGVCCLLMPPTAAQYVGGFFLLPGSLLPSLLSATGEDVAFGPAFKIVVSIAAIMLNAVAWRSAAQILEQ
jgi:hypothetical protein